MRHGFDEKLLGYPRIESGITQPTLRAVDCSSLATMRSLRLQL
jgi:hypothetical protein